jgi:hypothetical protein
VSTIREEFDKMFADLQEKAKLRLNEGFAKIFEKYPDLTSFGWGQWTTYFNDGDECYFNLRDCHGTINEYQINQYECGDDEAEEYAKNNPWIEDAQKDIWDALNAIPEDIIKMIYGDHVLITIKRDGSTKIDDHTDHD